MQTKPDFYTPQNEKPEHSEKFSPSGKYRLDIHYYSTRKGCWNYSRGRVYRVADGELIADIKRNYSTFHHGFVVKDGTEYLIGGRSYMNQTIVNLDEAREVEVSDKDLMKMGTAFCWAQPMLTPDGNTLVVDGCHWACPYEFKFFDFTNPDRGWPELPIVRRDEYDKYNGDLSKARHEYLCSDEGDPEFNDDGTITVYETTEVYLPAGKRDDDITEEDLEEYGEAYNDDSNWDREVDVRYTLRRVGDAIIIEDEWRSDRRQEEDRERAEWAAKDKAQKKAWTDNSPLWAELEKCLQDDPDLTSGGLGWCSSSQHQRNNGEQNFWFFYPSIMPRKKVKKRHAHLKWGTLDGPIQAELWIYGIGTHSETFDRSLDGLHKALETIRTHYRK